MYENLSLIYDSYMQDVDYSGWAEYLAKLINKINPRANTILEYGCGSGNLTLPLSTNFDVTGVDLSEEMLTLADLKLRGTGVKLFKGDLRNFEYNQKVDVILLACDTLTIFDYDDCKVFFKRAFSQLKPGGVLLFDVLSESYLKDYIAQNNFIFEDDDVYFIWTSEPYDNFIDSYFTFFIKEGDHYQRVDDSQRQYILDVDILKQLLEKTGFVAVRFFNFPIMENRTDNADRIQFIAVKPAD